MVCSGTWSVWPGAPKQARGVWFRLADAATQLQQGFSRVYGRYLLNKLVRSYQRKFADRQAPLDVPVDRIGSVYEFDDRITAPLNGFESANDYYRRCSCIGYLEGIETPTLILHATDDPLMTPDVVPETDRLGPGVTLELCRHGGHVGFIEGHWPGRPRYWLERRIPSFLNQQLSPFT